MEESARKISKCWNELLRGASATMKPGFQLNEFSEFDEVETRDHLIQLYREFICSCLDQRERAAAAYSLAALYKRSLMLADAKDLLTEASVARTGSEALACKSMLARIYAMEGNEDGLRQILPEINQDGVSSMWRLSEDELSNERAKGATLRPSLRS